MQTQTRAESEIRPTGRDWLIDRLIGPSPFTRPSAAAHLPDTILLAAALPAAATVAPT
jgi:hypothetical protein